MKIIEYVYIDAKDGRPESITPARHGAVPPVNIETMLARRAVDNTYPIMIGTTTDDIDGVAGVLRELDQAEIDELTEQLKADKIDELNDLYTSCVTVLESDYPLPERESWHVQVSEAKALTADAEANTPWIDAAAQNRGVSRETLADLIIGQDSQYRVLHGALTGKRQAYRDQIYAAQTPSDVVSIIITLEE